MIARNEISDLVKAYCSSANDWEADQIAVAILAEPSLSALQEQNKALREVLEVVAYMGHDAPMTWSGTELDWANRRAGMMQGAARKALAATKQESGE